MNATKDSKPRKANTPVRGVYSPPKLIVFGPVGALTQSGTGFMTENMMGMGMGMGGAMRRL